MGTKELAGLLKNGKLNTVKALEFYDGLEPVDISFMLGKWKGSDIPTGHRFNGLLAASGWYGKMFTDQESVHPLLFYTADRKGLFAVNPTLIPLSLNFPKVKLLRMMVQLAKPVLGTKRPLARLRMIEYRGKVTACMVYDTKPIIDCFRKLDEHTLMGAMDLKGEPKPYFFLLERDETDYRLYV